MQQTFLRQHIKKNSRTVYQKIVMTTTDPWNTNATTLNVITFSSNDE